MFNYFRKWRAYTSTRRELSSLTNRDLRDIGITSGDIRRISMEAYSDA